MKYFTFLMLLTAYIYSNVNAFGLNDLGDGANCALVMAKYCPVNAKKNVQLKCIQDNLLLGNFPESCKASVDEAILKLKKAL